MKFDDLEKKMKEHEFRNDIYIPDNKYIIIRLDGRSFSKLTKEKLNLIKPFDERFNQCMSNTVQYLMKESGFDIIFGYFQSDEISLLLSIGDKTFNRRVNKIISTLSGIASSFFSIQIAKNIRHYLPSDWKEVVTFDARISELSSSEDVLDYFRWRKTDAERNCIQGYCYWNCVKGGMSGKTAQNFIKQLSYDNKIEFLTGIKINYEKDVLDKYKYGTGFYFEEYNTEGYNPLTKEVTMITRRGITVNESLNDLENNLDSILQKIINLDAIKTKERKKPKI